MLTKEILKSGLTDLKNNKQSRGYVLYLTQTQYADYLQQELILDGYYRPSTNKRIKVERIV